MTLPNENFHCWKAFEAGTKGTLGSHLTYEVIFGLKMKCLNFKCVRNNSFNMRV